MVVLNIYGKIEPICISNKLKLYLGNLPNEEDNDWNSTLVEELEFALQQEELRQKKYSYKTKFSIKNFHKKIILNSELNESATDKERMQEIADNMICIYFDYNYYDMPLGGWEDNPFDGRLCEKDYAEFIVEFWNKMGSCTLPNCIYSSNLDEVIPFRLLFMPNYPLEEMLTNIKAWGKGVDDFLRGKNDYLKFDYLVRAIYDEYGNDVYQFFKWYSLCQLFLEKEHETELDWKLPNFLDLRYSVKEREQMAVLFKKMRNKIAHGDFRKLEYLIEEYAKTFMDGKFDFDYSEFSRKNWAIQNAMFKLRDAVKHMIHLSFTNRNVIDSIKKQGENKSSLFYIKPKDSDIVNYLKTINEDISEYICRLIKEDISRSKN